MFAVPGWSVSADALKAETAAPESRSTSTTKSKKRKRGGASPTENVTASNVADLYESVIGGRKDKQPINDVKRDNAAAVKRLKKNRDAEGKVKAKGGADEPKKKSEPQTEEMVNGEGRKKRKEMQQQRNGKGEKRQGPPPAQLSTGATSLSSSRAATTLTPLQASMRDKLISARFRHLNETLYTRPSDEAYGLFQESPDMFDEYHEGFRRQVKVWPENPVDSFLADIRLRAKAKAPGRGRPGAPPLQQYRSKLPLPRTMGLCTIADLGCGDARLAASLQTESSKLHIDVKSFDLQSPNPLVTRADIASLPLEDGSVNVAIFCLALMGTNWIDFIEEAYRILHWKGELWVAEIKSRFGPVRNKHTPVGHSVGNRKKAVAAKKGKAASEDDAAHAGDLAVEVDGTEDRRRATDVSAFVEALRRRGFVLQGQQNDAVDMSNKMFVKMHFTKGTSPTRGKGVKPQDAAPRGKNEFAPKWDGTADDDKGGPSEAGILKPCVYKIR